MLTHHHNFREHELTSLWRALMRLPGSDVAAASITQIRREPGPRSTSTSAGLERHGRFDPDTRALAIYDSALGWSTPSTSLDVVIAELIGGALFDLYGRRLGLEDAGQLGRLYADFHLAGDRMRRETPERWSVLASVLAPTPARTKVLDDPELPAFVPDAAASEATPIRLGDEGRALEMMRHALARRYGGWHTLWELTPAPRPLDMALHAAPFVFVTAARPAYQAAPLAYEGLCVAYDATDATVYLAADDAFERFVARANLGPIPGHGRALLTAWYGLTKGAWPLLVDAADETRPHVQPVAVGRDDAGAVWVRGWTRDVRARSYERHTLHITPEGRVTATTLDEGLVS